MDDPSRVDEKKKRLLGALEQGQAQLHLDARRPGVIVPLELRGDLQLVLNVSYRFDPPDLSVSDWGVRETLSFSGSRFTVGVPWSAVYAVGSLVTRDFCMYPDDMPAELLQGKASPASPLEPDEPNGPRAILREVLMTPTEPGGEVASNSEEPKSPDGPSPPRRGHLRVVK